MDQTDTRTTDTKTTDTLITNLKVDVGIIRASGQPERGALRMVVNQELGTNMISLCPPVTLRESTSVTYRGVFWRKWNAV